MYKRQLLWVLPHVVVADAARHLGVDGDELRAVLVLQADARAFQRLLGHDVGDGMDDGLCLVGLHASAGRYLFGELGGRDVRVDDCFGEEAVGAALVGGGVYSRTLYLTFAMSFLFVLWG